MFQEKNKDGYDIQYNAAIYGGGLPPLSDHEIVTKFVGRWGTRGNDPSKTEAMACYVINSKEDNTTVGYVNIGTSGNVIDPITKKPMYEFGVLPTDGASVEAQAEAYNTVLVKYPTANKGTMVSSNFIIGTISAHSHVYKKERRQNLLKEIKLQMKRRKSISRKSCLMNLIQKLTL